MGSTTSFPDPQSFSLLKSGSRPKHPATTITEGHKMRNGYPPQEYYNPYQDFGLTPQVMHTIGPVRGKPLIFAAMEANIDQQQPAEEQKVSVRLWDGQDRSIGPNMGGYMTPISPAPAADHKRAALADDAPHNVPVGYPSPPSSELSYPRAGKVDPNPESSQKSNTVGSPTKYRKLSKARRFSIDARHASRPSTPVKARPLTPVSPGAGKSIAGNNASSPVQLQVSLQNEEPQLLVPPSLKGPRNSGMALLDVGEDPFAKTEGVRMLSPSTPSAPSCVSQEKEIREKEQEKGKEARRAKASNPEMSHEWFEDGSVQLRKQTSFENGSDGASPVNHVKSDAKSERGISRDEGRISRSKESEAKTKNDVETRTISTVSLEYRSRSRDRSGSVSHRLSYRLSRRKTGQFSSQFVEFICDGGLLGELLSYLSFYEWCMLASVSKDIRTKLVDTTVLKEVVLERFLRTVGYVKWCWEGPDPLPLSLI
ncbi:hypothetical protein F5887DRAFT_37756 [Amanita rubescens]|nr:hypothetical protein F5887DRAFT_37756 [Amanita rubescens]